MVKGMCIDVGRVWKGIKGCVFLWFGVYDVDLHGKGVKGKSKNTQQ